MDVVQIVYEVAANNEANGMLLGLLGLYGGDDAAVGNLAPDGYLVVSDEDDGFGAGCHSVANATGKLAKIIGEDSAPYVGGRSLDKVTVILGITSDGIENNVGGVDVDIGKGKELGGCCNRGDVIGGLGVASLHQVAA